MNGDRESSGAADGLGDRELEALAQRVVELLAEGSVPPMIYVDTAQVARMFNVSQDWVRGHAAELGAIRVGGGSNGPLRFHVDRVVAAMERRRVSAMSPASRQRRPRRHGSLRGVKLLPLPEDARA